MEDLYWQVLSTCSVGYKEDPTSFVQVKRNKWKRSVLWNHDLVEEKEYWIENQIPQFEIYQSSIQKSGVHFICSDFYSTKRHKDISYNCFIILNGNSILKWLNHNAWETYDMADMLMQFPVIEKWQQTIVNDLQSQKTIMLQEIHTYETFLPFDIHALIVDYMLGITFLDAA